MGGFLSALGGSSAPCDVFIDFENAKPTEKEMKVFTSIAEVMEDGEALVGQINDYKGCVELQRNAMMHKTPDAETVCFDALLEHVALINNFFNFARKLEGVFPALLDNVCSMSSEGKETIADKSALAKQVAEILDFTLRFDQERMSTAPLSNDFSYYRRLLPKFSSHPDIIVGDDEASTMAMFTAEHMPMMVSITKAAAKAHERNPNVLMGLALMANSCRGMIEGKRFANAETNLFCARAMAGAIVLYDRIDGNTGHGVFHKKSPVQLKLCVNTLKRHFPSEQSLLNAIHYSTITFRNASSSIQALFD